MKRRPLRILEKTAQPKLRGRGDVIELELAFAIHGREKKAAAKKR
jgi:hypothetical protein